MVVIDSSSLILLAKLNLLDILIENTKHKFVISKLVYEECLAKKESFDSIIIEERVKRRLITIRHISSKELHNKITKDFNLGKGEAEAIALCAELKLGIITDDKKAINACRILKIRFTTVARLIVQLYKRNLLTKIQASSMIKELQKIGRYSEDIITKLKEDLK